MNPPKVLKENFGGFFAHSLEKKKVAYATRARHGKLGARIRRQVSLYFYTVPVTTNVLLPGLVLQIPLTAS